MLSATVVTHDRLGKCLCSMENVSPLELRVRGVVNKRCKLDKRVLGSISGGKILSENKWHHCGLS